MKINFFLPGGLGSIVGGYKVVYQYANELVKGGNEVNIYYVDAIGVKDDIRLIKLIKFYLKRIKLLNYPKWFKLDSRIKQKYIKEILDKYVEDSDISVATAYETSYGVSKLSNEKGKKKIYFIQDYELWNGISENELQNSYKLGMINVVVSNWLKEKIEVNSQAFVVENGLDLNIFKIKKRIDERCNFKIAMLYHESKRKRCFEGIQILEELKKEYPELQAHLFGSPKKPKDLPEWIDYTSRASEKEVVKILNEAAIYVCTSCIEGFGLPGMEAMACGCALVSTKCMGVLEYANENNSFLCEVDDFDEIKRKIIMLINDYELRRKYAKIANCDIQNRDIKKCAKKFEDILINM